MASSGLLARFAGRVARTREDGSSVAIDVAGEGGSYVARGDSYLASARCRAGQRVIEKHEVTRAPKYKKPEPVRSFRLGSPDSVDELVMEVASTSRGRGRSTNFDRPSNHEEKMFSERSAPSVASLSCSRDPPARKRESVPVYGDAANEKLIKQPQDQLFFSRKARPVNFEPYTLEQYRMVKPEKYFELGKLQPDLRRDDLVAKRNNNSRVKEFSESLREHNKQKPTPTKKKDPSPPQTESKRDKALAFARNNVPRPRLVPANQNIQKDIPSPTQQDQMSYLDHLEAKHDHMRSLADSIRRQYHF